MERECEISLSENANVDGRKGRSDLMQFGTNRSYTSRVNNSQGRILEDMIMGAARMYEQEGKLVLHKESEPFRVVKNLDRARGRAEVQFTAKAQPDFIGCIKGGRLIAFEAKYTQKDTIKQAAVTPTQAAMLERYHKAGAAAFVCCGIGTGWELSYFMVPWKTWRDMKENYGHKYASADDLAMYEIKADTVVRFLEYKNPKTSRAENNPFCLVTL